MTLIFSTNLNVWNQCWSVKKLQMTVMVKMMSHVLVRMDTESCVKIKDEDDDRGSIGKKMHDIIKLPCMITKMMRQFQSMNPKLEQDWEEVKKTKGLGIMKWFSGFQEHVLYENPGGMRKVLYPNRGNSALCPVRILQEEHAMRPLDGTCPSCLFLCIKYGGKTRNIPQNEYVRQPMGRNKLKSFGPLICVMARLVNIRTGSFFFKALGITLLFMAGFSGDIVQSETNRKLDLFQKYYRTDEDAAGEELFLGNLLTSELAYINPDTLKHNSKTKKSRSKKQPAKSTNNNKNSENTPQGTIAPES